MTPSSGALAYREPDIIAILILASFLLLLNAINYLLDRIVYCGLVGQILIGVAYGLPGADWLPRAAQDFIMQFGYLGLILIVYEGGLSTNLKALKANLALSLLVAFIGISTPIALSFVLQGLLDITPLQSFAAGAALCSTSLGTTFTVLSTSGLTESRLCVVLTSAAMMDDVVGLVMVQVISNLGSSPNFRASTVLRPVGVSLAFACLLPVACAWIIKPLAQSIARKAIVSDSRMAKALATAHAKLIWQTLTLLGLLTGVSYAGASALFAAYLAGVCVVWWDELDFDNAQRTMSSSVATPHSETSKPEGSNPASISNLIQAEANTSPPVEKSAVNPPSNQSTQQSPPPNSNVNTSGLEVYTQYYGSPVNAILKPFFFASIGFSIPISKMFTGSVVWRGFIYAGLMILAKLSCGICLIRFSLPSTQWSARIKKISRGLRSCWPFATGPKRSTLATTTTNTTTATSISATATGSARHSPHQSRQVASSAPPRSKKPLSLYPAAILGSAMVARGEIGFLISSVAQSNGIYNSHDPNQTSNSSRRSPISDNNHGSDENQPSSELFLVVTWAILICTVLGPMAVGLLVRRVRRLQDTERQGKTGKQDPLGIWGISSKDEITTT